MTKQDEADEEAVDAMLYSVNRALLAVRAILGETPSACPVCFIEMLMDALADVQEKYEHGESVPPLAPGDLQKLLDDLRLEYQKPLGRA